MFDAALFEALRNAVDANLIWWLAQAAIATGAAIFLKNRLQNWASYFMFMINKRLGINVRVQVREQKGTITGYNSRWIFVKTDENDVIIVPISRWENEQWMLLDPDKCKDKD